jgi:DNA-binding MurR/RpiR family transcriptional regulator
MIYTFGSGGVSSWMVEEIHNRLFRLGLRITSSSDHQIQMMLAATVERGDVVFASSAAATTPKSSRRRASARITHGARRSACEGRRSCPDD